MSDLDRGRVIDVAETNETKAIDSLWQAMPKVQRDGVRAVSMDMWEAFINSTRNNVKQADRICSTSCFEILIPLFNRSTSKFLSGERSKKHLSFIAALSYTPLLYNLLPSVKHFSPEKTKGFCEYKIVKLPEMRPRYIKQVRSLLNHK